MNTQQVLIALALSALLAGLTGCACSDNNGNIDDPFGDTGSDTGDAGDGGDAGDTGDTGDTGDVEDTGDAGDVEDTGDADDMGDAADMPDGDDADVPVPDEDNDGVPDDEDLCPGSDDNIDEDNDDLPDGCDPCVREGAPNDEACPVPSEFDTSFGDTGIMILEEEGADVHVTDLAWSETLGLVIGGSSRGHGEDLDFVVARLQSNGALDPAFGTDGWFTGDVVGGDDSLHALAVSADGTRIVLAGAAFTGDSVYRPAVAQITPAGVIDVAFGEMGWAIDHDDAGHWQGVLLDDAGNATVVGTLHGSPSTAVIGRYLAAGTEDPDFTLAALQDFGFDTAVTHAAHGPGNVTYAVGHAEAGYDDNAHLLAIDAMGGQHPDFNGGAALQHDHSDEGDTAERLNGVRVDAEGRIVVTGEIHRQEDDGRDLVVARYLPSGMLDASFGDGGIVSVDFDGGRDVGHDLAVDAEGRIVVVGRAYSNGRYGAAVLRLMPDGTPDAGFGNSGKLVLHVGETSDRADAVAIDGRGRIVVAGRSDDGVRRRAMLLRLWD